MADEKKFPLREAELPWNLMAYNGVDVEWLRYQKDLVDALCRGEETSSVPIYMKEQFSYEDRKQIEASGREVPDIKSRETVEGTLRTYIDKDKNEVKIVFTSRRPFPDLKEKDNVYMGHSFTEEDQFMLLSTNSIGRAVTLKNLKGESFEAFVGLHPITNAFRYIRSDVAEKRIPKEVCGHEFTAAELETLKRGDIVHLKGLKSSFSDKPFDSYFMFSPGTWNTQFLSEKKILNNQKTRGVVPYNSTKMKNVVGVVKVEKKTTKKTAPNVSQPKGKSTKKTV